MSETKSTRICSIEGCNKPDAGRRGWCGMHYHRWYRNGSPHKLIIETSGMTLQERIEHYSEKVPESGCWIWMGSMRSGNMGYGQITVDNHGGKAAHRASYIAFNGEIPDNLCVLHKCDIPLCVNPNHLFLGTHLDNMQDAVRKGRVARGEKSPSSILKDIDVVLIKKRLLAFSGYGSCANIAREYSVGVAVISAIKRGRTWAHICV